MGAARAHDGGAALVDDEHIAAAGAAPRRGTFASMPKGTSHSASSPFRLTLRPPSTSPTHTA